MKQASQNTTFFRLTPGVRDRLLEINLTAAEWRIWCYLVSLDPFGDRGAKFSPAKLMLKCGIKKSTYFVAKAKFQKLGLFDFVDGVTKVINCQTSLIETASEHSQQATTTESENSESQSENSESQSENSESQSENSESQSENSESRPPKKPPDKKHSPPQTLKTYTDFKKTLSEGERENFFNFVRKKTENLEKPINDLEAWLASKNAAKQNRWEIYHKLFKDQQQQKEKPVGSRLYKQRTTYTLEEKQAAIARFKAERNRNRPEIKDNSPLYPENNHRKPKNE